MGSFIIPQRVEIFSDLLYNMYLNILPVSSIFFCGGEKERMIKLNKDLFKGCGIPGRFYPCEKTAGKFKEINHRFTRRQDAEK